MVSALQQSRAGENNQDLVDIILKMELQMMMISSKYGISIDIDKVGEREEREETNRRRRLQRRREEKGEKGRQRGRLENNEATSRRQEEETVREEGGCSHCRGSVATECVYLCQKGHLHRDLPGEVSAFASRTSLTGNNFLHLQM